MSSKISRSSYAAEAGFDDGFRAFYGLKPRRRRKATRLKRDYIARELDARETCLASTVFGDAAEPAGFCMRN